MNESPAVQYLRETIDRAHALKQLCLPSLRTLVKDSGISRFKMWNAVQELCKDGVLITRKNQGIFIKSKLTGVSTNATSSTRQAKFKRIVERLQNEIRNGSLGTKQNLPSCKELCSQFGVNHRTMQKALQVLAVNKVVEPWYSGYRILSFEKQTGRGTIVLIGRGNEDGILHPPWRNLNYMETECHQAGVNLLVVAFFMTGELYLRGVGKVTIADIIKNRTILGFHIWTAGIIPHPSYYHLLEAVNTLGKPVAILNHADDLEPEIRWKIPVRMYPVGLSPTCGRSVTEYLISAGHTRLAFVSLSHEFEWSRNRLAGIEQTVGDLQIRERPLVLVNENNPAENQPQTRTFFQKAGALVQESFAPDNQSYAYELMKSFVFDLGKIAARCTISQSIKKLFWDTIIKNKPTAIIAGNDLLSVELKLLLESSGFSIPEDIALIGFDNTYEATINGLTSYDFNELTIIRRMIEFVIDSRAHKRIGFEKIEIDGYIVERGSVGTLSQPEPQLQP